MNCYPHDRCRAYTRPFSPLGYSSELVVDSREQRINSLGRAMVKFRRQARHVESIVFLCAEAVHKLRQIFCCAEVV